MSDTPSTGTAAAGLGRAEALSALFAQLVMQQANMAMMLLGKVAHPETGAAVKDLDAARLFIDELEMLEVKTKGNLDKDETALLKQTLMSVRLAFVEAVESPSTPSTTAPSPAPPSALEPDLKTSPAAEPSAGPGTAGEEHRAKFSKKY